MTDNVVSGKKMDLVQLLEELDLVDAYMRMQLKIFQSCHMMEDKERLKIFFDKNDELKKYIYANSVGTMTFPEIKVIIQEWIAQQESEV